MQLHEGQKKFLRNATAKINVLNPANRYGKSVIIAVKHIHRCFYKKGVMMGNMAAWAGQEYRTANIAPQSAMTEPVFSMMKQILTSSFAFRDPATGTLTRNKCQISWFYLEDRTLNTPPYKIHFANNSYTEHRSLGADKGDSLQGKPYGYISYDEGGRSDHLEREMQDNILPRLFDWNGEFDLVSTPDMNSPSILYHYELFEKGKTGEHGYYTQEGTLRENTFFTPEQIEAQYQLYARNPIGPQVLEGKFVFAGDNLYPADDILAAQDHDLDDGRRYQEGHKYIISVDTAIGEDEMVYTVLDDTTATKELVRQIACKGNSKSPQMHLNDFVDLVLAYKQGNNVRIILETWNGESARFYQDLPRDLQIITKCFGSWQPATTRNPTSGPKTKGRNMRTVRKADMLIALRKLLASRELKIPYSNRDLIKQMSIYREDDRKIPTDRVISLALGCWMATEGKPKFSSLTIQEVNW